MFRPQPLVWQLFLLVMCHVISHSLSFITFPTPTNVHLAASLALLTALPCLSADVGVYGFEDIDSCYTVV